MNTKTEEQPDCISRDSEEFTINAFLVTMTSMRRRFDASEKKMKSTSKLDKTSKFKTFKLLSNAAQKIATYLRDMKQNDLCTALSSQLTIAEKDMKGLVKKKTERELRQQLYGLQDNVTSLWVEPNGCILYTQESVSSNPFNVDSTVSNGTMTSNQLAHISDYGQNPPHWGKP